jgi:hypothetical protein
LLDMHWKTLYSKHHLLVVLSFLFNIIPIKNNSFGAWQSIVLICQVIPDATTRENNYYWCLEHGYQNCSRMMMICDFFMPCIQCVLESIVQIDMVYM